jgi:hypothetical protein
MRTGPHHPLRAGTNRQRTRAAGATACTRWPDSRGSQIVVRLNRRTYSPVLRQASLPQTITVLWWEGRTLRYEYA